MGNNQGGFHKRERMSDGPHRMRLQSSGSNPLPSNPSIGDDGCPVQVWNYYIIFILIRILIFR